MIKMTNIKVCRICVKESSILYNLFQLTALDADGNEVSIHEMLSYCCSAKLQTTASLWICASCSEAGMKAYNFIKLFHKNDEIFKKLEEKTIQRAKNVEIKIEIQNYSESENNESSEYNDEEDIEMDSELLIPDTNINTEGTEQTNANAVSNDENLAKDSDRKNLQCSVCKMNFTAYSSLKRHLKKQHSKKDKKVFSTENLSAEKNEDLDKPRMLRSKLKPSKLKITPPQETEIEFKKWMLRCPNCGTIFRQKESLDVHLKQVHRDEIIICEECDEFFSDPNDYVQHFTDFHYTYCTICEMKFTNRKSFMRHWLYHERRPCYVFLRNNRCPLCPMNGKFYRIVSHLKNDHAGEVVCNICHVQFEDVTPFLEHYMREHRIRCEQCGMYCTSRRQYDTHFNPNFADGLKSGKNVKKGVKRKRL